MDALGALQDKNKTLLRTMLPDLYRNLYYIIYMTDTVRSAYPEKGDENFKK